MREVEVVRPRGCPGQERKMGALVFHGVGGWRDGTDGDLKSCNLFAVSTGSLVFREKHLE